MSAKYTGQWTQRANLNPISKDLSDHIISATKSQTFTIESTAVQASASRQFKILAAMWGKAMENGLREGMDSLAEEILYNQATKIRQYGTKAYPLSEKQVAVIWNHVVAWASR